MKQFRPLYWAVLLPLLCTVTLHAQLSQLARIVSMESRAAVSLGALEGFSTGARASMRVPEYLSASSVYRSHYEALERSTGGSLMLHKTFDNFRPISGGGFVFEVEGYNNKSVMDVNPDHMEPYLANKYALYAGVYRSVYHKNRLEPEDSSIIFRLLYTNINQQIWTSQSTMTSSGGGGRFVGNYPPTISDYPESAHEGYRNKEEEPEENDGDDDDDDDDNDDDNDDNNDDDSTDVQDGSHSDRDYTLPQDPEEERNNTAWLILGILAYWLFSSAGIWRIFLKTGRPSAVAFVPFWRLGQLAEVAGARAYNAWWLLVPGVNLVFWVKLNQRLCAKFQCPRSWAIMGIFLPGLLWLFIGYSNRYFIGKKPVTVGA